MIEVIEKRKAGAPRKDKRGEMLWVTANHAETVKAFIAMLKLQTLKEKKAN